MVWSFVVSEINRHSELQFEEYVGLLATWHHDTESRQYNCASQIEKMKGNESRIKSFRLRNGCGNVAEKPRRTVDGINFHDCFCDHLSQDVYHWLDLFRHYESGTMPFPGSYVDQPAKAVAIFRVLARLKSEWEEKLRKEMERKK